ncbi:MAG: ester cyclase [Pseudomonadota bacterium]
MDAIQAAKETVRRFHAALDNAAPDSVATVMDNAVTDEFLWRGVHPFGEIKDAQAVAEVFWSPLKSCMARMQRRDDIFFAGRNEIDNWETIWVVAMGHLMGLFDAPWLDIRPTGRIAMLRYCTFHRIDSGQIAETVMHVDIPHLMAQAGQSPFPPQTGVHLIQPGPMTHDGLLFEPKPQEEATATLNAINAMVRTLNDWKSGMPLEEELALDWHDDMIWWGPEGIGSTYTIERYAKQHSAPFRAGFSNRAWTGHIARLAEGHYGGFFGWPNFTAEPTGSFMGMPATGRAGDFRVIDIYRRSGDKLAENWIFIDLLHFWKQQGLDVLGRHRDMR